MTVHGRRTRRWSAQPAELLASRHPRAGEMDAYERVLGDAMAGDATLFAREDYVEEAWRIVDPVLAGGHPGLRVRARHLGPTRGGREGRAARRLGKPDRDRLIAGAEERRTCVWVSRPTTAGSA